MKIQINSRNKGLVIAMLLITFLIYSCKKEEDAKIGNSSTNVIVNLLGVTSNITSDKNGGLAKSALVSSKSTSAAKIQSQSTVDSEEIQTQVIPFSDNLSIVATLTPEDFPTNGKKSAKMATTTAPSAAVTGPQQQPLDIGVKYRVLVYNSAGNQVYNSEYVYGDEATMPGIELDGEETYTFIAYSINSKSAVPNVEYPTLTAAMVSNVSAPELMYFKKVMKVSKGDNYLDVVLVHQFSQITTTVDLSALTVGNISSINSTTINPTHTSASIKLSDGAITYGTTRVNGSPVLFDAIVGNQVRTITSSPTSIISPATASGKFSIGSITVVAGQTVVGGTTVVNSHTREVVLDDLRITPGRKYNLNLQFVIPCTEIVDLTANNIFDWTFGNDINVLDRTVKAPSADFGFLFDVLELDNSFNMRINGENLITHATHASREVQFQTNSVDQTTLPQNIQFADGSIWEFGPAGNQIPAIWQLRGSVEKPVFRLVISPEGKVSMYGSKRSGGRLFPLVLNKGFKFNDIVWNKDQDNTVIISQFATGPSLMKGSGFGKKIISCP